MDNRFNGYENQVKELVLKFEKMQINNESFYFDVEEFEIIIDYYLETENIEGMNKALQCATRIFPKAIPVMIRRAQFLAIENQTEKALNLLDDIEVLEPENIDIHFIKGTIYSQLQRSEKAIEEYNKALSVGDDDLDEIYSNIAWEYESLGKHDKAIEYFKKTLDINPLNDTFLFDLASNMDIEQQHAECIVFLEQFIQKYPYSFHAWFNLGMTYMRIDLYEKAIEAFDFVLCIDNGYSMAYSCKAICYSSLKEYTKSIEVLKEGMNLSIEKNQFRFLIGQEYEYIQNYETAILYYKKTLEEDPAYTKAHLGLGVCYDKLDDFNSGYSSLLRAIELEPHNPEVLLTVASIFSYREHYEEAFLLFERCTKLEPDHLETWIVFSDMYADQFLYDKAIEVLGNGRKYIADDLELVYRIAAYNFLIDKKNSAYLAIHELLEQDSEMSTTLLSFCPEMTEDPNILHIIETYTNSSPFQSIEL